MARTIRSSRQLLLHLEGGALGRLERLRKPPARLNQYCSDNALEPFPGKGAHKRVQIRADRLFDQLVRSIAQDFGERVQFPMFQRKIYVAFAGNAYIML
jgi:hypothetical protein